jgi:Spy/CpxP family protein refolding chaperone
MESILTPEQKQQFEKMKADKKEGRKNGEFKKGEGFGRKGGFDRDGLAKELNLTQDQQDRVAKIRSDFRSQFVALRNDKSLSDDQRKTKFKELMKAQQAQMKTVLTPEQVEKMKLLRKEHSSRNTR